MSPAAEPASAPGGPDGRPPHPTHRHPHAMCGERYLQVLALLCSDRLGSHAPVRCRLLRKASFRPNLECVTSSSTSSSSSSPANMRGMPNLEPESR